MIFDASSIPLVGSRMEQGKRFDVLPYQLNGSPLVDQPIVKPPKRIISKRTDANLSPPHGIGLKAAMAVVQDLKDRSRRASLP